MTYHRDSTTARNAGITYHLVPEPVWTTWKASDVYTPEAFEKDGFIHCTNGLDQLIEVANMFYTADPREFQVLALEVNSIAAELRYDDEHRLFPHIYGPLNTSAVVDEFAVIRADDGTFVSITE